MRVNGERAGAAISCEMKEGVLMQNMSESKLPMKRVVERRVLSLLARSYTILCNKQNVHSLCLLDRSFWNIDAFSFSDPFNDSAHL